MGGGYMGLAITFTKDFAEIPPYREQALWIRRKSTPLFFSPGVVGLKESNYVHAQHSS